MHSIFLVFSDLDFGFVLYRFVRGGTENSKKLDSKIGPPTFNVFLVDTILIILTLIQEQNAKKIIIG